jgi:hypothetical protein
MDCPNCGRTIRGKAEVCLVCGTRFQGGIEGEGKKGRRLLPWIIAANAILLVLCIVIIFLLYRPALDVAALWSGVTETLGSAAETLGIVAVTPTPFPTRIPTETPLPTSTPTRTPTPTATPTLTPSPTVDTTLTPSTLLPEVGRPDGGPLVFWALGGALAFLGYASLLLQRRRHARPK